jgi:hypothetical protein
VPLWRSGADFVHSAERAFPSARRYSDEIAVAGSSDMIDAIMRDTRVDARHATADDDLDIDD